MIAAAIFVMRFLNKKLEKKHNEQQEQLASYRQTISMLIIDKKKMRLKDAGFPDQVVAQMPKLSRLFKYPVVKAKVGNKIMSLLTEKNVFSQIPVRKEIKADVSGLYITAVRSVRGGMSSAAAQNAKKESKFEKLLKKGRGEA
ncbi:MAG: hypothetical protein HUJ73_06770 [Eubacterium sp.]|nr:hypothetical protein [Eubacterium sp.]